MDLSAQAQRSIVQVIGADCFKQLKFQDEVRVSTKISILVDQLVEYEYDFVHTFLRNEESLYNISCVDREVQTDDHEASDVVQNLDLEQNENKGSLSDPCTLEVKVEQESEGEHDIADDDNDDNVTKVLPEYPGGESSLTGNKKLGSCPLCPAKFYDSGLLEDHLKKNHSVGLYICPVCNTKCKDAMDFTDHVVMSHCDEDNKETIKPTIKATKPKKKPRSRKQVPKKFVVDNGSDTDEGYMDNENITLKIKKCKKVVAPKPKKKTSSKPVASKKVKKAKVKSKPKVAKPIEAKTKPEPVDEDNEFEDKDEPKPKRLMEDKSFRAENGEVKCIECGKEYKSKRALRRHFSVTHEDKEHICEICGNSFKGKESLYHHKRGVHENLKVYKCQEPGCDASFNFSHSLRLHRLKHSGARPHMCNVCGKTYLTAYHLKVHMQATHSEKKNFACKICNKLFSYTTSLKMHEATHDKVERVKCEKCDKSFVNQQALKYHVMSKHTEPGHFPCDECGKVCRTEFLLRSHKKRHSIDSTRFMCDMCGRQFMYKSALDMHRAIHRDEKAYVCKICNKSFKTYPTLYSHQYVHKEESPFTCSTCGKSFKTKERLKAHERRHSGLKPFKCMICQHCFPDNGGLSKHMRTVHCKVKKFVCDICGKATSRADNLRVHMKVHMKGTEYRPKMTREKGSKQGGQNMPAVVPHAFDSSLKKERHGDFFDHSEDSHSNSNGNFPTNGYEPNMQQFSTVDASQISTTSADQNMPLNLHQDEGNSSQAGPLYIVHQDHGDRGNRGNSHQPTVSTTGGPNHMVTIAPLQPSQYLYPWPYPYPPPTMQSQSGSGTGFFQQQ